MDQKLAMTFDVVKSLPSMWLLMGGRMQLTFRVGFLVSRLSSSSSVSTYNCGSKNNSENFDEVHIRTLRSWTTMKTWGVNYTFLQAHVPMARRLDKRIMKNLFLYSIQQMIHFGQLDGDAWREIPHPLTSPILCKYLVLHQFPGTHLPRMQLSPKLSLFSETLT